MESTQVMESHSCDSSGCHFIHAGGAATFSVVKGKRTKRQRLHLSTFPAAAVDDSSSICTATRNITEEDEDMANCLILLAHGRTSVAGEFDVGATEKYTSEITGEAAPPPPEANGKDGCFAYECKTCSRCFPSFQALGGHRASHKKPKPAAATPATTASPAAKEIKKVMINENMLQISMNSLSKQKTHECSICGAEFSSGQALGGHMRRHRPLAVSNQDNGYEFKKERRLLSLDLNLPAPSDDDLTDGFRQAPVAPPFSFSNQLPLIFPAPASAFGGLPLLNIAAN